MTQLLQQQIDVIDVFEVAGGSGPAGSTCGVNHGRCRAARVLLNRERGVDLDAITAKLPSRWREGRARIDWIDSIVRPFDERREDLHLTKADLARRADMKPEAVRRLFSAESPNPTLSTLVALADALDLDFLVVPRQAVPVN